MVSIRLQHSYLMNAYTRFGFAIDMPYRDSTRKYKMYHKKYFWFLWPCNIFFLIIEKIKKNRLGGIQLEAKLA